MLEWFNEQGFRAHTYAVPQMPWRRYFAFKNAADAVALHLRFA
jgi:hypothetical protein